MPIPERVTVPGAPEPKDPSKKHFYISLVKSVVRIAAGAFLVSGNLVAAGTLLIGAEILGILEEL
jgi:hypothetical protein